MECYAYDARLEEVTPRTLRRILGKNLVNAGVRPDRAACLLGHQTVDTPRIYTTPSQQTPLLEVEQIAQTWRGARPEVGTPPLSSSRTDRR